jgi:serpin B
VDYIADPDAARKLVNAWVKRETAGRIPNLLAEPDVTALTRLILVNAMYLRAPWLNPFDAKDTKPGQFTRADGSRVSVPMMTLARCQGTGTCELPYAAGADWRAAELPYLGGSLAMTIVVPDDLAAFEKKLTPTALTKIIGALRTSPPGSSEVVYDIALSMPRFGIDTRADLAGDLEAMGMPLAFDPELADFTGIATRATLPLGLYSKKVIHQASIDVDEKGTEAAAATAVEMATGGGNPLENIVFKIDRPFMFLVRDIPTGAVLFMGRVVDPSAK